MTGSTTLPGVARHAFHAALRSAGLTTSARERSPWEFRVLEDGTLELHGRREPSRTVADPGGREAVISCGAALLHVMVALQSAGHAATIERLPDPASPDLLARVRLGAPHQPTAGDAALAAAIHAPWPDVTALDDRAIAPHVLSLLLGAARMEGAWLGFIDHPTLRPALADLVAEAKLRLESDPRRRRERALTAHRNVHGQGAGADVPFTAGLPELPSLLGPPAPRTARRDATLTHRVRRWVEQAPTVAVLMTPGDTRADWLIAGVALGRVLLTARAADVAASYLNQAVELGELRPRVAALVRDAGDPGVPGRQGGMPADAVPQIMLRLMQASVAAAV